MIIITGSARFPLDQVSAAAQLGAQHSARSRQEPGCIAHNCHIDVEDPQRIVFVEEWIDIVAVKAHFAVPESGEFIRAIGKMAENQPEMRIFLVQQQHS